MVHELVYVYKELLKRKVVDLSRKIGRLYTPMDMVILCLRNNQKLPDQMIALDLFGHAGLLATSDYAPLCNYLEFWEINPLFAKYAHKFLRNAAVQIGDSVKAVKAGNLVRDEFNFVFIDNPLGPYCADEYCEHFDLFPYIFKYLTHMSVIVTNLILDVRNYNRSQGKNDVSIEWIRRRKEFYHVSEKEALNLQVQKAIEIYKRKIPKQQFSVSDIFIIPRNSAVSFLVICLSKNGKAEYNKDH